MIILCIKTTEDTSNLVLNQSLYYTTGIPQRQFDAALILGSGTKGEIPLLAECDVITIDECTAVDSSFSNLKQEWQYEWKLQINNTFKPPINLLNYVGASTDSFSSIQHCQVMSYIDSNDLINPLPITGNMTYVLTQAALQRSNKKQGQTAINNNVKSVVTPIPLKSSYTEDEMVTVRTGFGINPKLCQGKIIGVEDIYKIDFNGNKILVDQKLKIMLPNNDIKKYLASKISSN